MNRGTAMVARHQLKANWNSVKGMVGKATAAVVGSFAAVGAAMAQSATLASTATSKLSGAESDVQGILIILLGIVFMFVLYSLIKRAK